MKYLLTKIGLVVANGRDLNHIQLQYMVFMLDEIKLLLKEGRDIDIRDLIFNLHKVGKIKILGRKNALNYTFNLQSFPGYYYDLKLLDFCIKIQKEDLFVNCAIHVISKLETKKTKEVLLWKLFILIEILMIFFFKSF